MCIPHHADLQKCNIASGSNGRRSSDRVVEQKEVCSLGVFGNGVRIGVQLSESNKLPETKQKKVWTKERNALSNKGNPREGGTKSQVRKARREGYSGRSVKRGGEVDTI